MSSFVAVRLRLFVAGDTENSAQARENLAEFCRRHFGDQCEIEIIDVMDEPLLALKDKILMTPTLIRLDPLPQRRIVGTLSNTEAVLRVLGPVAP